MKKKAMNRAVRAELNRIEKFLMGKNGAALADVLAALRGPDVEQRYYGPDVKAHTTVHIRRTAFPKLAAASDKASKGLSEVTGADDVWCLQTNEAFRVMGPTHHFIDHIERAATVLGLK